MHTGDWGIKEMFLLMSSAQWAGYVADPPPLMIFSHIFLTKNDKNYASDMNLYVFLTQDHYFMPIIVLKFTTVGPKITT